MPKQINVEGGENMLSYLNIQDAISSLFIAEFCMDSCARVCEFYSLCEF